MIVCVEGINGSGKSTLARSLRCDWAHGHVIEPVRHTVFGQMVSAAIMATDRLTADAETLAFAAARLQTAGMLSPSRCQWAGELIVLERWAGAVVAYGKVAGTSPSLLHAVERRLTAALPVDVTVLLDTPGDIADSRVQQLAERNRFETQGPSYLEQVRRQYLAWAAIRQVPVIDGRQEPFAVAGQVMDLIIQHAAASGFQTKENA